MDAQGRNKGALSVDAANSSAQTAPAEQAEEASRRPLPPSRAPDLSRASRAAGPVHSQVRGQDKEDLPPHTHPRGQLKATFRQ